jgi:S1-C subfamily serine protease
MASFTLSDFSEALAAVVTAAAPSLAAVHVGRHHTVSAFHWRDGLFVSAQEMIADDEEVPVTLASGDRATAEIVGRDPSTGIALLKTGAGGVPILGPARQPARAGHLAVAVGHGGEGPIAAFGAVGAVGPAWRSMRGGTIDRRINLAMAIGGRFEGAAALDASGGLVGMILFGPRRRALVIPAETIERVGAALADKGYVARGYLGAGLHPVRHGENVGAMVMSLDDNGPAKAAGMHLGDIITGWDGEGPQGPRDLMRRLGPDSVGRTVSLTIVRGGAGQTVAVTIGARPRG